MFRDQSFNYTWGCVLLTLMLFRKAENDFSFCLSNQQISLNYFFSLLRKLYFFIKIILHKTLQVATFTQVYRIQCRIPNKYETRNFPLTPHFFHTNAVEKSWKRLQFLFLKFQDIFTLCHFPHPRLKMKVQRCGLLKAFHKQLSKEGDYSHIHIIHVWKLRKSYPTGFTAGFTSCHFRVISKENIAQQFTSEYIHTGVNYTVQNSKQI